MATTIVTIIMFLVLVSIHEFGHYITAKAVGIRVLEFAIGMGPTIWKKQKGETLYSLRAFPIGGFCSMEGEDKQSDDTRAFCNQKLWKRFLVAVAGATLNVILGFVIFMIIVSMTAPIRTTTVESVDPVCYAAQSGLMPGDRIVEINGDRIGFYPDIADNTREITTSDPIHITVKRDGQKVALKVKPSLEKTKVVYGEQDVTVTTVTNGVEKTETRVYNETLRKDEALIGKTAEAERYIIGFMGQTVKPNVFNVISEAGHYTVYVVKMVYKAFFDMIRGAVGIDQLSGPIGVVNVVNDAVHSGRDSVVNVLNLVGLLTINLGIFNLLPIPALDGGRIFFMLIEAIRRKPIPAEKETMIHVIGFMLLIGLMIFVAFNDVFRIFFNK